MPIAKTFTKSKMNHFGYVKIEKGGNWKHCHRWYKVVSWLFAWIWSIVLFIKLIPFSTNIYLLGGAAVGCWYLAYKFGCTGGIVGNWVRHFSSPSSVRIKNPSAENVMPVKLHWLFHYQLTGIGIGGGLAFLICFFAMIWLLDFC